jgi:hypothetical protein
LRLISWEVVTPENISMHASVRAVCEGLGTGGVGWGGGGRQTHPSTMARDQGRHLRRALHAGVPSGEDLNPRMLRQ